MSSTPQGVTVEAGAEWLTVEEVRALWGEADAIADDEEDAKLLALLVAAALDQCAEYAPPLAIGALVPARYRLAQLMQVRALWQSAKAGPGNQIGADGEAVTVFPMDWTVTRLLRPKRGVGAIA